MYQQTVYIGLLMLYIAYTHTHTYTSTVFYARTHTHCYSSTHTQAHKGGKMLFVSYLKCLTSSNLRESRLTLAHSIWDAVLLL